MLQFRLFILKVGVLLFSCLYFQSCVQTSYKYFSRKPSFQSNDHILIGEVIGMPSSRSYELFEWAKAQVDTQQHRVLYTTEQEYTLMRHGINPKDIQQIELPKEVLKNIHTVLGTHYFLLAEVLPLGGTDKPFYNENTHEATIVFHLYHLLNDTYSYHYRIKTTVHPFEFGEDMGILSGVSINTSNEEKAAIIAFRKGWKKLSRKLK